MATTTLTPRARRCVRKFLRHFPGGFADETYVAWERDYKWKAHETWNELLAPALFRALLRGGKHAEIASRALRIESRTNLLFSFGKMALRDAVRTRAGAREFALGLGRFLHGRHSDEARFERWCATVEFLPRRQTRVLTWPIVTVFGFIARPDIHVFLKPMVTKVAAREYGFDFAYMSPPSWPTQACSRSAIGCDETCAPCPACARATRSTSNHSSGCRVRASTTRTDPRRCYQVGNSVMRRWQSRPQRHSGEV